MVKDFLRCGTIGWCVEVVWTSLKEIRNKHFTCMGTTSLWMFPIYGMAAFLKPLCRMIHGVRWYKRGMIYTCCIYAAEFVSGTILKKKGVCPWDYSHSKYHINGLIRLDYAPGWFLLGLLYEKCLAGKQQKETASL